MSAVQLGVRRARYGETTTRRSRVLFIGGSLNQTTQLHAIARELDECDVRFTPYYGDPPVDAMRRLGLIEMTIGGQKRRRWCLEYLREHALTLDMHGREGAYDLVVTCTDLVVPHNVRRSRILLVQEGIVDPEGFVAGLCRRVPGLPRWLAGTALTGQSGLYDRFCVASEGYRDLFISRGADGRKLVVTGVPNFDDCRRYLDNAFQHRGYVLVCTSDARETFKRDNRAALVRRALGLAGGRLLVFKLHPNENHARSAAEIRAIAPGALVYASGSAEEMIANADCVLTQWSSTVLVALALGKEVHADFPLDELRLVVPVQNGGKSAKNIARVCRELLASSRPLPIGSAVLPIALERTGVTA
jgi:hypothetical protein